MLKPPRVLACSASFPHVDIVDNNVFVMFLGGKEYYIMVETAELKDRWIDHIQKCSEEVVTNKLKTASPPKMLNKENSYDQRSRLSTVTGGIVSTVKGAFTKSGEGRDKDITREDEKAALAAPSAFPGIRQKFVPTSTTSDTAFPGVRQGIIVTDSSSAFPGVRQGVNLPDKRPESARVRSCSGNWESSQIESLSNSAPLSARNPPGIKLTATSAPNTLSRKKLKKKSLSKKRLSFLGFSKPDQVTPLSRSEEEGGELISTSRATWRKNSMSNAESNESVIDSLKKQLENERRMKSALEQRLRYLDLGQSQEELLERVEQLTKENEKLQEFVVKQNCRIKELEVEVRRMRRSSRINFSATSIKNALDYSASSAEGVHQLSKLSACEEPADQLPSSKDNSVVFKPGDSDVSTEMSSLLESETSPSESLAPSTTQEVQERPTKELEELASPSEQEDSETPQSATAKPVDEEQPMKEPDEMASPSDDHPITHAEGDTLNKSGSCLASKVNTSEFHTAESEEVPHVENDGSDDEHRLGSLAEKEVVNASTASVTCSDGEQEASEVESDMPSQPSEPIPFNENEVGCTDAANNSDMEQNSTVGLSQSSEGPSTDGKPSQACMYNDATGNTSGPKLLHTLEKQPSKQELISVRDKLKNLLQLRKSGQLTQEEYQKQADGILRSVSLSPEMLRQHKVKEKE